MFGAVAAALGALPMAIARLPVADDPISARRLLERIRASETVTYQALAESRSVLGLPDVPRAGRLIALFGETTRMRVWRSSPYRWRVDELTPIGERDTYSDASGIWMWDSADRDALRVNGFPNVRFARPADLLPPELGRRLAAAAVIQEATRIPARRIAGITAPGLRLRPRSNDTTIEEARIWAAPGTGLPLRVEITATGGDAPVLSSSFLEIEWRKPRAELLRFDPAPDAHLRVSDAPDFARAVDRYSEFVLPDELAGEPLRSDVASAAGTYGRGFALSAVLALPERFAPNDELDGLPTVQGSWGEAKVVETPLFSGMIFTDDGVTYVLGGTVGLPVLQGYAAQLASAGASV